MTKGQEAQSQAHSCCHRNNKAACHTANTFSKDEREHAYFLPTAEKFSSFKVKKNNERSFNAELVLQTGVAGFK